MLKWSDSGLPIDWANVGINWNAVALSDTAVFDTNNTYTAIGGKVYLEDVALSNLASVSADTIAKLYGGATFSVNNRLSSTSRFLWSDESGAGGSWSDVAEGDTTWSDVSQPTGKWTDINYPD